VLELLPRADDDAHEETTTGFSPEELLLRDLVNLAMTIREDGQVKEICEGNDLHNNQDDLLEKLPAAAVKLAKVTQSISTTAAQDIARALLKQEGDAVVARARLQALRNLLTEAERFLARD
jgi:hypothetical protein